MQTIIANNNCNDGLDNDCDGFKDGSEPECLICTAEPLETNINIVSITSDEKPVKLTYEINPSISNISIDFEPDIITPPNTKSVMKITVDPNTPSGIYNIVVRGIAGDVTRETTYTLIIPAT